MTHSDVLAVLSEAIDGGATATLHFDRELRECSENVPPKGIQGRRSGHTPAPLPAVIRSVRAAVRDPDTCIIASVFLSDTVSPNAAHTYFQNHHHHLLSDPTAAAIHSRHRQRTAYAPRYPHHLR